MQNLQLSIPEPCHENWQQMTPTDQGRFCNACAKEVIDFSTMTDIQVLNYFSKITNEKVCGRALPEQLDRTLSRPEHPKKRLFWYWNYIVMFFMFFAKGNSAKAQGGIKPVTECSPVKGKSEVITVAGYAVRRTAQTITGKVTDKDGIPVSFASVKIKGTNTGIIADAKGDYTIKVNPNAVLIISSAGFKTTEVLIGNQTILNTVLEKSASDLGEVIFTPVARGMKRRVTCGAERIKTSTVNPKIFFEVKEDNTGLAIDNAAITITRKGDNLSDKILSDNKGIYKFTEIKISDSYFIKVEAEGYESNEFTIDAKDIKDREKPWEVLLGKKKTQPIKSTSVGKTGTQNTIRLGGMVAFSKSEKAIYVIDGIVAPKDPVINPDDIEDVTILQSPDAVALFGPEGANGAIIVTTRKTKEIKMKEVVVTSEFGNRRMGGMTGGISVTNQGSHLNEIITTVKTKLTDSIKVYPNPVPRNTGFTVALKLKQAGNYSMQIADASGRILLQQKFNANAKDHTEKIMGDSRWAAGVYYIRVFDNKNQLISKTSFIFE